MTPEHKAALAICDELIDLLEKRAEAGSEISAQGGAVYARDHNRKLCQSGRGHSFCVSTASSGDSWNKSLPLGRSRGTSVLRENKAHGVMLLREKLNREGE
jgi:hypothetical protein